MAAKNRLLKKQTLTRILLILLINSILFISCSDETESVIIDDPDYEELVVVENEYELVNEWIYEQMDLYYLWTGNIPQEPDMTQEPAAFFESLLNTYDKLLNAEGDRFSFINEDADELLAEFSGESKSFGMEFRLFYISSTGNEIVAQVIYVLEDSPADLAGLQRGDMFTEVNGAILDDDNYYSLLFENDQLVVNSLSYENDTFFDSGESISLTATVVQENPIFMDSIYDINETKIGYLLYNQFIPGPYESTTDDYDLQLEEVFAEFKSGGITELIIDLRYNPGGYVTSATTLASLIGTGVNSSSVFFREEYNTDFQNYLESAYGSDYFSENFDDRSANIGTQINGVFFLVTNYSASSSELVINGLKPYMNVTLIGEQTYGKNVGSFTITDDESESNNWALQPIVMKAYNSLGQSDYTAGFTPDIDAYEIFTLFPFGDIGDPLLGRAIGVISGAARIADQNDALKPDILELSVGHKPVSNRHISILP